MPDCVAVAFALIDSRDGPVKLPINIVPTGIPVPESDVMAGIE